MTDPQQSTVDPIFRPMSPSKRQASQRKPFALSSVSAQTSSRLRRHRTSVPPTPHSPSCRNYTLPPTAPHTLPPCPRFAPNHTHSHTPDTSPDAPPCAPTLPPHPNHTPDVHLPPQIRMQFPNRSDSVTQRDTNKQGVQRELHAKLQHLRPLAGPVATPPGGHRTQAATHPDR